MKLFGERFNGVLCFIGGLIILLAPYGCQTSNTNGTKEQEANGAGSDQGNEGETQGEEVQLLEGELRQVRKTTAELMTNFSSDQPRDWKRTARKLRKMGNDFLPDFFQKRIKRAQKRGPEGERARKQLVQWGQLKSIVLKLPSRDPDQWDQVRKQMLEKGGEGKEMFVLHMIDFLKKPNQNRQRAAEQLAKCGESVVNEAWARMEQLAGQARKASEKGKTIPGAMIILQGLAQVQVHAERWSRIRSALQHRSMRIRMAMAQALGQADQVSRATKLLEQVVRQDPSYLARNAAVKALGVFDRSEEAIEPLAYALKDSNKQVVESASEALRYFHQHEQTVVRSMINVLGELQNNGRSRAHRTILHRTLKKITKHKSIKNSYRAWAAWYRQNYN